MILLKVNSSNFENKFVNVYVLIKRKFWKYIMNIVQTNPKACIYFVDCPEARGHCKTCDSVSGHCTGCIDWFWGPHCLKSK